MRRRRCRRLIAQLSFRIVLRSTGRIRDERVRRRRTLISEKLKLLPADIAKVFAVREALQVIHDHILRALQDSVIRSFDPHRKNSVRRLEVTASILRERDRAVLGRKLDREFVTPVFANLLEISAGRGGRNLGLRLNHPETLCVEMLSHR